MGRFFALAIEGTPIQTKSRTKTVTPTKTNWGAWVMAFLTIAGIVYLLQVNALATQGYEIKSLQKKIVELKDLEARLELESASLQSIQRIEEAVKVLNLVPSGQVNYPKQNGYAYESILLQQ